MNKFSIIIPTYNSMQWIKESVNSVLVQSLNDFELIILDSGSADQTLNWINSIGDIRFKIFRTEKKLSIEENWGRIISLDRNEFMTILGHDDILHPNYLKTIDALINKHPDASLYQTHFSFINADGEEIRKCLPMDEVQTGSEFLSTILSNTIDIMGTGFMMRAKDYDSVGGIPGYPNLLFADFALWMKLTNKNYKATSFEECFAFRRHLSTTTLSPDIKMQQAFSLFIDYLEKLKTTDAKCADSIQRYSINFIKRNCKGLAHRLLRTPKNKRENLSVASFLNDCKQYADRLQPNNNYNPVSEYSVKLASQIDSNIFTRGLFLAFKKIYSKPILD
ncbi:MAG TPA: glycosyltransferase [Puia sp.]|nr:glycosyltransferase [Puia sp.]